MEVRIKNTAKGQRGVYINSELCFVDGGSTSTFTGASADERDVAATIEGFRVQSSNDSGKTWTDHFNEDMPEEMGWVAVATDASGSNMKALGQYWYVGTALASEKPDGPAGYTWTKVGGADVAEPIVADVPVVNETPSTADLVKEAAPVVIAAITPANAMDIGAAEEKREGGPRKGVMKAVEEAMGE